MGLCGIVHEHFDMMKLYVQMVVMLSEKKITFLCFSLSGNYIRHVLLVVILVVTY